ncbi:hypothetical protein BB559_003393 [Furculomyces boomerangus]|uniref:Uncharacterized protein n=1 Tax=Furculomyces boomerangus TaxID=61424 RepID=A0A2T9YLI2_9FUNG|nr:hypothetical protein BB559_003393 [Furculomyces boomerangus]
MNSNLNNTNVFLADDFLLKPASGPSKPSSSSNSPGSTDDWENISSSDILSLDSDTEEQNSDSKQTSTTPVKIKLKPSQKQQLAASSSLLGSFIKTSSSNFDRLVALGKKSIGLTYDSSKSACEFPNNPFPQPLLPSRPRSEIASKSPSPLKPSSQASKTKRSPLSISITQKEPGRQLSLQLKKSVEVTLIPSTNKFKSSPVYKPKPTILNPINSDPWLQPEFFDTNKNQSSSSLVNFKPRRLSLDTSSRVLSEPTNYDTPTNRASKTRSGYYSLDENVNTNHTNIIRVHRPSCKKLVQKENYLQIINNPPLPHHNKNSYPPEDSPNKIPPLAKSLQTPDIKPPPKKYDFSPLPIIPPNPYSNKKKRFNINSDGPDQYYTDQFIQLCIFGSQKLVF